MVIKRNGQKVEFEKNKIREAVKKAWIEVKNGINNKGNSICDYVADERRNICRRNPKQS